MYFSLFWFYRNRLVKATGDEPLEELSLRIKHKVLSHEKALEKARREVEAFENFVEARREPSCSDSATDSDVRLATRPRKMRQVWMCGTARV